MHYISSISDYCHHINIAPPYDPHFDVRRFSDNMPSVKRSVAPFQHEFYAIGILFGGTSHEWSGIKNMTANLIFNSPYQLISWEIENDWDGYYLIFTQEFLQKCHFGNSLLVDFPFLKLDEVAPISIPTDQIDFLHRKFEQILTEYRSPQRDKFAFIESYLQLILLSIRRFTKQLQRPQNATENKRSAEVALVSRYQFLIENKINEPTVQSDYFSTSYYANELAVHPNHLNAVVKRITGKTAKQLIQEKLLLIAKSLLLQTDWSIKEIAFQLGYNETAHFHHFFKKVTSLTPTQFRAAHKT